MKKWNKAAFGGGNPALGFFLLTIFYYLVTYKDVGQKPLCLQGEPYRKDCHDIISYLLTEHKFLYLQYAQ